MLTDSELLEFIERTPEFSGMYWVQDYLEDDPKGPQGLQARVVAHSVYAALERVRADEREACARVCDELAKRNFPWGSENSDRYHAQADWAEKCAAAIRARKEKE